MDRRRAVRRARRDGGRLSLPLRATMAEKPAPPVAVEPVGRGERRRNRRLGRVRRRDQSPLARREHGSIARKPHRRPRSPPYRKKNWPALGLASAAVAARESRPIPTCPTTGTALPARTSSGSRRCRLPAIARRLSWPAAFSSRAAMTISGKSFATRRRAGSCSGSATCPRRPTAASR